MRILIDMDGVVYDLSEIWFEQHNADFPEHMLTIDQVTQWDTQQACNAVGCKSNIYSYFSNERTWTHGKRIAGSREFTRYLSVEGYELGFLTTVPKNVPQAAGWKLKWAEDNFPHIPDIMIVNGHIKHWVKADILIDDAPHNLEHFEGVSILFDQPWNQHVDNYPRAKSWYEVYHMIHYTQDLLRNGYSYVSAQHYLQLAVQEGEFKS